MFTWFNGAQYASGSGETFFTASTRKKQQPCREHVKNHDYLLIFHTMLGAPFRLPITAEDKSCYSVARVLMVLKAGFHDVSCLNVTHGDSTIIAIKYNSDICKSGFQMIADDRIERCTMQFPLQKQSPSLISLKNACLFISTRLESEAAIQTTPDLIGSLRRFYSNKFTTFYKVFIPFSKTKL